MRQYYTLIQPYIHVGEVSLEEYLSQSGIKVDIGADLSSELVEYGLKKTDATTDIVDDPLLKKYVVLLEEHELTAIKLSINNIQILENRPTVNLHNKMRGCFKWFLR